MSVIPAVFTPGTGHISHRFLDETSRVDNVGHQEREWILQETIHPDEPASSSDNKPLELVFILGLAGGQSKLLHLKSFFLCYNDNNPHKG